MAYNNNNSSPSKTDRYGTHFTAWTKMQSTKSGKAMWVGYIWLPSGKGIKVQFVDGNIQQNKNGDATYPVDITIFKPEKRQAIDL